MNQKIVIDNFLGGLAPSRYLGNPNGQADPGPIGSETSAGWDIGNPDEAGLLRRGFQFDSVTNSGNVDGPIFWAKIIDRSSLGQYMFMLGHNSSTTNKLYRLELANTINTPTLTSDATWPQNIATDTATSALGFGTGMELYNGYLYYSSGKYLGRYDLSVTFNHSFSTSLSTKCIGEAINHPMVSGNGQLLIASAKANGGPCIDSYDGTTLTLAKLDLSKIEQIIRCIEFDGSYLYIGLSSNNDSTGTQFSGKAQMIVWDTVSASWQQAFNFPEETITNIKAFNGKLFAWGKRGFYQFTGGGFTRIRAISGGPIMGAVDISPNGILYWKSASNQVYAFGPPLPGLPEVTWKPYETGGSETGFLKWANYTNMYLSNGTSALRRYSAAGAGGYGTAEWRTPMIKFPQIARLVRIKIYFLPLTNGTTVDVKWAADTGSSTTTLGTISTASSTDWEYQPNGLSVDSWQIILSHTGGSTPKFKKIEIEYAIEQS